MSTDGVAPTDTLHAITSHTNLQQASSYFHAFGNSYEQRYRVDAGISMKMMAAAMGNLGSLVPSLAGAPPPLFDGPAPFDGPLETMGEHAEWHGHMVVADVLSGQALPDLAAARLAVSRYWSDAMAEASEHMQDSLKMLTAAITPCWKVHLHPLATWEDLIDMCSDTLGNVDTEAIVTCVKNASKVGSGISRAPVTALSQQP